MSRTENMRLALCIRLVDEDSECIDAPVASVEPGMGIEWIFVESAAGRHRVPQHNPSKLPITNVGDMEHALPAECDAVVYVHPACSFTRVALDRLLRETRRERVYTHYTLQTQVHTSYTSVFHGYLLLLAVIDQFWTWFNRHRHPLDRHVNLVCVITVGGRQRHLARRPWYWRLWNDGECAAVASGRGAQLQDVDAASLVRRHRHIARLSCVWGNAWLAAWYMFFAGFAYNVAPAMPVPLLFSFYGIFTSIFAIIAQLSTHVPLPWAYYPLWPLYLLTFPLFVVYARIK